MLAVDVQAEVEAKPPPLVHSLTPLEPQITSSSRTKNPMFSKSNSKSVSKLIAPHSRRHRLPLLSTTRSCPDSKHLLRRMLSYAIPSGHATCNALSTIPL